MENQKKSEERIEAPQSILARYRQALLPKFRPKASFPGREPLAQRSRRASIAPSYNTPPLYRQRWRISEASKSLLRLPQMRQAFPNVKDKFKRIHDKKLAGRHRRVQFDGFKTPSRNPHPSEFGDYVGPSTMPAVPSRRMHNEDEWGVAELTPAANRMRAYSLHPLTLRGMEGPMGRSQNSVSTRQIRRPENDQMAAREFPSGHRDDYDGRRENADYQQWRQPANQLPSGRSISIHPGDQIHRTPIMDRDAQIMASMRGHGFQHNEVMHHQESMERVRHNGSRSFQNVPPYHGQFEQDYNRHAQSGSIGRQITSPYGEQYRPGRTPGSQFRGYDPRDVAFSQGQFQPGHLPGLRPPGFSPGNFHHQQAHSPWGNEDRARFSGHGSENVPRGRSQSRGPQPGPYPGSDPRLRTQSQAHYDRRLELGPENNVFQRDQASFALLENSHYRSQSVGPGASRPARPIGPPRMPRQETVLDYNRPVARSRSRTPAPTNRNIETHRVKNTFANRSPDFAPPQNSIPKTPQHKSTSRVEIFSKAQQKALDLTLSEDSDEETPLMNNFFNRAKAKNVALTKKLDKGKSKKGATPTKLDKGKGKGKEVSVPNPAIAKTPISKPSAAKKSHASKASPVVVDLITPTPAKPPRHGPVLTMKELLPPRAEKKSTVPKVARLSKAKDAVKDAPKAEEEVDPKILEQIQAADKVVHRELEVERIETEKELFDEVLPESEIDKEKRLKREAEEKEAKEQARAEALQKEALRESNRQQKLIREAIEKEERQKAEAAEEEAKRLKREEVRNRNLDIEEKLTEAKRKNAVSIVNAERKQQEEEAAERERQKKQTSGVQANQEDYADLKAKQEEAKKQAFSLSAKKKEKVPEKSTVQTPVVHDPDSAMQDADDEPSLFVPETPALPEGQFSIAQIRQNLEAEKKLKEQQRKEKLFGNRTQSDTIPPTQSFLSRPESSSERNLFAKSNKGKAPAKAKAKPKSVPLSTLPTEEFDIEGGPLFTEPNSPSSSYQNQANFKPTSFSKDHAEEHQTPRSKKVAEDVPENPLSAAQVRFRKNLDLLTPEQISQIAVVEKRKDEDFKAGLEKKRLAQETKTILLSQEESERIAADEKRKRAEFEAEQEKKRLARDEEKKKAAARKRTEKAAEEKKQKLIAEAAKDGIVLGEDELKAKLDDFLAKRAKTLQRRNAAPKRKAEGELASQPDQKKSKKGSSFSSADGKEDEGTEDVRQRKAERERKIARARERNPGFAAAASFTNVKSFDAVEELPEEESTSPKSDDEDDLSSDDDLGLEDDFDFSNLTVNDFNSAIAKRPPQPLKLSKYTPTKAFTFFNGNSSKQSSLLPRDFLDRAPVAPADMDNAANTNVNIYRVLRQVTDEKGEHKPKLLDLYGSLDEANQRVFDEVTKLRLSPLKIQGVMETQNDDGLIWCQVTTDRTKGCCITFSVEVETRMSATLEDFDQELFQPRFRSCIYQIVQTTIAKDPALAQSSPSRLAADSTNLEEGDEDEAGIMEDDHPSEAGTIQHDEIEAGTTQNEEIEAGAVQTEDFEAGTTYNQEIEAGTIQIDTEMVEAGAAQIEIEVEASTENYGMEAQIDDIGAGQVDPDERDELMDDFNALMEQDEITIPEPPQTENTTPFMPVKVTKNLAAFTNLEMANHEAYALLCTFLKPTAPKMDWLELYSDIAKQLKAALERVNEDKTTFEIDLDIDPRKVPWLDVLYIEIRVEKIELKGPLN